MLEKRAEHQLALPSLDKLVVPADPPEIAEVWKKKGFTNFDFFHLSAHEFESNGDYPGWNVKPESWFWENVKNGRISSGATRLYDMLIAIDHAQKPNYNKGMQLYPNDPFGDILRKLRQEGKIKVPKELKHIPDTSRFGISSEELIEHVLPAIAWVLEVDSSQVGLPTETEVNIISNLYHREWGDTNTCEWMQDRFEGDGHLRLIGGFSANGLEYVRRLPSDGRDDNVGFRPLVVLSSETR